MLRPGGKGRLVTAAIPSLVACIVVGCGPSTSTQSISNPADGAGATVQAGEQGGVSPASACSRARLAKAVEEVGRYRGTEVKPAGDRFSCGEGWAAVEVDSFNGAATEREVILFKVDGDTWVSSDRDEECGTNSSLPAGVRALACDS